MSFLDRFKKKPLDREVEDAVDEGSQRVEPRLGDEAAPWVRVDPETGEIHPDDQAAAAADTPSAPAATAAQPAAPSTGAPSAPPPFDPYGIGAAPFEEVPPADESGRPVESAESAQPAQPAPQSSAPAFVSVEVRPEPEAPAESPAPASSAAPSVGAPEPIVVLPVPSAAPVRSKPEQPEAVTKPVPRERARAAASAERAERSERMRGFPVGAAAPKGPSEEELIARRRTKNRLVGAAVLMAALVVAAPFIMDDPVNREAPPISTEVPPVPPASGEAVTTELPLNAPAAPKADGDTMVTPSDLGKGGESVAKANLAQEARDSSQAKPSKTEPAAKTDAKADAKPAAKPADAKKPDAKAADAKKDAPKPDAKPAVKPTKTAGITPPAGEGWYVQVMATSSERQAEAAVKKIVDLGLPAYRVPVEKGAATLWRVRVGLYKTKKDAEGVVGNLVLNGIGSKPYVAKQ
ncbi:MAG: SPOR domain-containing protein [Sutterella sp.]|nr:SPOR domain-containing protein [Sutterella sp.]